MAKFEFTGLDEWSDTFEILSEDIQEINSKGLYEGAKVIADSVNREINSIPEKALLNDREKDDLKDGLVVGKHQHKNGETYTFVDFAGYNHWKTKDFPNGMPIRMIAASICRGSSVRKGKYNFVRKAFDKVKKEAEEAMEKTIEEELNKKLK